MSQSPPSALLVRVEMQTDTGRKRQQNQDAIGQLVPDDPAILATWGQIVVLADGVGGLPGGDLASQYAVSTIISGYYDESYAEPDPAKRLARAIAEANSMIYDEGQSQNPPTTMATTVVAAVIRDRDLIVGSVGDSPAYLLRNNEIRQLTQDHNLENLQRSSGAEPTEDHATGQKLVRALGHHERVKVDIITGRVRHGDYVILCSDGLTRYASPDEIAGMIADMPVQDAVVELVNLANERGGADNISVIVIELSDENESLLLVRDPMESWGQPRKGDASRPAEVARPAERIRPAERVRARLARTRDEPGTLALLLQDILTFMRSNTVITSVGLGVLLIVFVVVMLVIAGLGEDDTGTGQTANTPRPDPTVQTATAAAAILLTDEANLAATQSMIARRTLTPPTPTNTPSPIPTYGPQLDNATWFRVLDGDPIPSYADPAIDAESGTPLDPGSTYRVTAVETEPPNGPWYRVLDNLGLEGRWVNGPGLHQRIIAVNEAGIALPPSSQPLDVPPPGTASVTPAPAQTEPVPTGTPGASGTGPAIATPPTPAGTATPTPTPNVTYGVETWTVGTQVTLQMDLDLCRVPDVDACDAGAADAGTTGIITDGPTAAGEHWWWEVELPDGRAGWIAQVLLGAS